jgi:hypothetical protein
MAAGLTSVAAVADPWWKGCPAAGDGGARLGTEGVWRPSIVFINRKAPAEV